MTLAPIRIVFAGTPEFAVPTLEALLDSAHKVVAVYTQPDRRSGRGQRLKASPIKSLALGTGVNVRQPGSLKTPEATEELAVLDPDLMVVVAYGQLLPPLILEAPRVGCINVHASLLPRWRGAAPIQRAILAGDAETGVTIMRMNETLDGGPILRQTKCAIEPNDTSQTLHDRLARLGAECLIASLASILDGSAEPMCQDERRATYAPKIERTEAELDWSAPARVLERKVRAVNPKPVAYTRLFGRDLRVWAAAVIDHETHAAPGTVLNLARGCLDVATGDGVLRLLRLQLPGRRPVAAADFLHAHPGFSTAS